jgi:hypothetical protein
VASPVADLAARTRAHFNARPTAATAITTAALIAGVVLRVLLALVNLESNDSHLPVISAIAFEQHFPTREQAWEGFQPKLYHTTAALVWRLLPTRAPYVLTRAAQLVSCVAGVFTLLVLLRFLRLLGAMREEISHSKAGRARLLTLSGAVAFAAVALNPALSGTSAQATNDAFVILFASLTLYAGVRVLAEGRGSDFAALVLWAILAGVSKGNGLAAIVAVATTFTIVAVVGPGAIRRRHAICGIVFIGLVATPVALIGPYYSHQRQYGTPFVTNWAPSPPPFFFYETFVERPGLTSIVHGLFTFRLVDLLRHPVSTDDKTHYPRHRTSLWSRVYAQAHSAHFESWPPSWKARSPVVVRLTSALLLLGLVPTALVAWGFAAMAHDAALGWRRARGCRHSSDDEALVRTWPATLLLLVAASCYLVFVAMYSIRLRDFSSMKTIFVLPALSAFTAAFELGGARLLAWGVTGKLRWTAVRLLALVLALLFAGYVADLSVLIAQLADDRVAGVPPSF